MGAHAKLAPSSANQWVNCPGSIIMQEQHPSTRDKAAADDGTLVHAISAHELGGPNEVPADAIIIDEMRDAVRVYVDYIDSIRGAFRVHVEEKVQIFPDLDCWGTLDARWYDSANDILHIWDLKYGWLLVEVYRNWQGVLYALGCLNEIKATHVHLHIVQPRPFHPDGPCRVWKTTADEIQEMGNIIARQAAVAALVPDPVVVTGPHCRWCSALYACSAASNASMAAIDIIDIASAPTPSPAQMSQMLIVLKRAAEMINHQLAAVEQMAISMDKGGTIIPGWGREFTAGRNKWIPGMENQVRSMAEMYGVPVDKPGLVTPAQATKAGLPADVVTMYSKKDAGKAKLVPVNTDKIKQLLGE